MTGISVTFQATANLKSVEFRHHDIEQDKVRQKCFGGGDRHLAVRRFAQCIAFGCEPRPEDVAVGFVVVDDQNARWIVHDLGPDRRSRRVFADLSEQRPRAEGLCHIGVAAGGACSGLVAAQRIGGDDNDRNTSQRRVSLDAAGRLVAVEERELNIHEDHIGLMRGRGRQRRLAVANLEYFVPGIGKKIAKNYTIILLILDHENAFGHMCPTCCSTLTGTSMKNVEPKPGADFTQIRPPCIATMRCEIDRPSPVPLFDFVEELSACWNSSKILLWSAGSMPGPVSRTESVNELLRVLAQCGLVEPTS
jgi:hypothetical protein